ncbi:MAG TPA: type I phosphomannose isomerase catalytic subunit [Flavobacteriaceae bacterium]|nr:type I phosphomannose isomerase catalytic subunit [Flavobacteriaceae bacterium]
MFYANKVSNGKLKGMDITKLMVDYHYEIMGKLGYQFEQFPLLLKFLDCNEVLSVQVHPSDEHKELIPKGNTGKSEAWIVMETDENSLIYAGLKKGTTKESLLKSIEDKSVGDHLHSFVPKKDDAIFIRSGTVHTLAGTVVFEVQQNSDVTFRLYDWDRTDPKTKKPRELQVEKGIECIDFNQVAIGPVTPVKSEEVKNAETLFDNPHFKLWRIKSDTEFTVGIKDVPVVLVSIDGRGSMKYNNETYSIETGEVMLLPAIIGLLELQPQNEITILQIAIPEKE